RSHDEHGERITPEYLDYALNDTQVTWECFAALRDRYAHFGLSKPIYQLYSGASFTKAHLQDMGVQPLRQLQHPPNRLIATTLETYFGGRTETRIRRCAVPGIYVDFVSQYPTVFVLQSLWRYLTAQGIDWHDEDPAQVQQSAQSITPSDLFRRKFWQELD